MVVFILALLALSQVWVLDFNTRQAQGQRLSDASTALLEKLSAPLEIRAYVGIHEPYIRQAISQLIGRYQVHKADMKLVFVDPEEAPGEIRDQDVQQVGELRLFYKQQQAKVTSLSEQSLSQALQQLSRDKQHWLAFLQGHGERDPTGQGNFDLSHWGAHLRSRGLLLHNLHFSDVGEIPDNTRVLVLASPRVDLLPEEIDKIQHYLEHGGNLLWLLDPSLAPDQLMGLGSLADYLGLEVQLGMVVDPGSRRLFGQAREKIALVKDYADHPISAGLQDQLAVLPESMALAHQSTMFQGVALLQSIADSWLETDNNQQPPVFDSPADQQGPLALAYALSRDIGAREQRIIVVADGDFLANQYLENSANLDLGLNMMNWLVKDEHLLNIPAHQRPDASLNLSDHSIKTLSFGFLFALPIFFLLLGVWFWWRQR